MAYTNEHSGENGATQRRATMGSRLRALGLASDASNLMRSAYIALQLSDDESAQDDGGAIAETIREKIHDARVADYLIGGLDHGLLEDARVLKVNFSPKELSELAVGCNLSHYFTRESGMYGTPESICNLAYAVLGIKDGDRVADLGCGCGDFLVTAARRASGLRLYGIDINPDAAAISSARLDLAADDWAVDLGDMLEMDTNERFDKVFCNHPLGLRPAHMRGKGAYYESLQSGKGGVGRPASADWVFNKLAYDRLDENGRAVTIVTNGATLNGGNAQARKYFVDNGMIQAVVALPENLFPNVAIPTVLVVLGKNDGPIRMVDATELSVSGRRWDTIGGDEIAEILTRLETNGDNSRLVGVEELAAADYILFPRRYLGRDIELENAMRIGDLALGIDRGSSKTARDLDVLTVDQDTGISYLRLSDITDGHIGDMLPHLSELDVGDEKHCVHNGDLLVSKNGKPFKVAVAEVPRGETVIACGNLYIIRLDTKIIDPYFAAAFLSSEDGRELMGRKVVGTAIPNLPLGNLRELELPVPDKETQASVARLYRARLDEIEVLKIRIEKARIGLAEAYDEAVGR